MNGYRRWLVTGLSAMLLAVGLGAAPVAVADVSAAATCTHPSWSNKDSGVGRLRDGLSRAALRTGPNEGCPLVNGEYAYFHNDIYYHCYVRNSANNTWTHVRAYNRFDNKSINGWIWDGNLDDAGALKYC
ncbi:SH3 domain-containing protein [Streptomyces sp. MS19]|uniref:SH3 domain-containing protein n=1 Tax=Streptomyces sp. MS19 TaxID=3385972 RepID=UPI00399FF431